MINGIFSGAVWYLLVAIAFPRISIKTSQTTRQESTPPLTIQIISVFFFRFKQKKYTRVEKQVTNARIVNYIALAVAGG